MSIAQRLRSVASPEELDELLREIAANPRNRWTRAQILFYLPDEYKRLAEKYFLGEILHPPPRDKAFVLVSKAVSIQSAVETLERLAADNPEEGERDFRTRDPREQDSVPSTDGIDCSGGRIEKILCALVEEYKAVDRASPKRYRLSDGRFVRPQGHEFVYMFRWSSDPDLLTPGSLAVRGKEYDARVGRQGDAEGMFEVLVGRYLGDELPRAIFRLDPTFLLRALFTQIKRIDAVSDVPEAAAEELCRSPDASVLGDATRFRSTPLNQLQRQAVSVVEANSRTYVWGPPGTGKTRTLGYLIARLVALGKRVLVVSPYNVAVDEAVLAAAAATGHWQEGEIVRFGRISERVRNQRLDLDTLLEAEAARSGLLEAAQQLLIALKAERGDTLPIAPPTIRGVLEELGSLHIALKRKRLREHAHIAGRSARLIHDLYRSPESRIINNARVVATTFALFAISPLVRDRVFDHVLVDEASVLRTPEAVLLMAVNQCPVSFFGDPKQLPPIVHGKSEEVDEWFRPNPFVLARISSPQDAVGACVMLKEQFRMAPPIRELVSRFFYLNQLVDGECPQTGMLALLDTSKTDAQMTTRLVRLRPSKENLVHRSIVIQAVEEVVSHYPNLKVLILSPFLAQSLAYKRETVGRLRWHNVGFGTVHASQGMESDIVILDTVLAPGKARPRFLDELRNPDLPNLMNVALSRARLGLLVIAHRDAISEKLPGRLLERIVDWIADDVEHHIVPPDLRFSRTASTIVRSLKSGASGAQLSPGTTPP